MRGDKITKNKKAMMDRAVYIVSKSPLNGRKGIIKGFRSGGNVFVFVYDLNGKTGAVYPLNPECLRLWD